MSQNLPQMLENTIAKIPNRIKINMIGYQSINCKSYVEPTKKSNAFTFLISLCNFRILNLENKTCRKLINEAINHPNLEEKNIKKEISKELLISLLRGYSNHISEASLYFFAYAYIWYMSDWEIP